MVDMSSSMAESPLAAYEGVADAAAGLGISMLPIRACSMALLGVRAAPGAVHRSRRRRAAQAPVPAPGTRRARRPPQLAEALLARGSSSPGRVEPPVQQLANRHEGRRTTARIEPTLIEFVARPVVALRPGMLAVAAG
jgi:hypothetical protein